MRFFLLLVSASAALAQQPQGTAADWDISKVIVGISQHAARLLPMVEQIDVKPWIQKGASYAYERQLENAKVQVKAVADSAQTLARTPGRLSSAIELTYRLQAVEADTPEARVDVASKIGAVPLEGRGPDLLKCNIGQIRPAPLFNSRHPASSE